MQGQLCALDVGEASVLHEDLLMDGLQACRSLLRRLRSICRMTVDDAWLYLQATTPACYYLRSSTIVSFGIHLSSQKQTR